jgi:hypothetical protein
MKLVNKRFPNEGCKRTFQHHTQCHPTVIYGQGEMMWEYTCMSQRCLDGCSSPKSTEQPHFIISIRCI